MAKLMRSITVNPITALFSQRFLRYILTGILNTVLGYALFWVGLALNFGVQPSLFTATILGTLFNFATTRRFVFNGAKRTTLPKFIAVYAIMYFANAIVLRLLIGSGAHPLLGQAVILPFNIVLTYAGLRRFVFKGR